MRIKTSSFQISPRADIEIVWQNLEVLGCSLLYSEAEEDSQKIFGNLPSNLTKDTLLAQYPEILSIESIELPEIDWEGQWSAHQNYFDGYLHVDLKNYFETTSTLKLLPGPGFGDHSHPTTRLVLKLMPSLVIEKNVLDVGCGSGILSLAAVVMGAKTVQGIDIDQEAIDHSWSNSKCNDLETAVVFHLPEQLKAIEKDSIVLMNMIQSEQVVAWESLGKLRENVSMAVSSGILAEARNEYLKQSIEWGWQLLHEAEEEGWLGFVFRKD